MRIKSIRVENFRAVKAETLTCDDLTALVGPNGAGKSTFLHALLVFQGRQKPTAEDFYNHDTAEDIEIAVTFTGLSAVARKKFAKYLHGEDLEVIRACRYNDGAVVSSLHGRSLLNGDFDAARKAPLASDMLAEYKKLRDVPEYTALPKCTSKKAVLEALDKWEDDNPGKCKRSTDDGRFFGFEEVASGYLGRFVRILYVPAVREASGDGTEGGRGSVLHDLLELTVKGALAKSSRYQDLQKESDAVYDKARDMGGIQEVKRLEDDINGTLGTLARGARVDLDWDLKAPRVGPPAATVRLTEDGYSTTIDRTGHGLQRAFIIAMLGRLHGAQADASAAASSDDDTATATDPTIVLAMEEPELYQHPTRARHLARLLSSISKGGFKGVAASVQVIYATHSPYFVGADRIGQIRMLRKADGGKGKPKVARVWQTDMDGIRKRLAGRGTARRANQDRLERDFDRILTPHMSEGFFADTAVLVEGDTDRIAVMMAAEMLGTPLDERGVTIIPCGSKGELYGPLAMFKELGVRTYVVWDGDNNKENEKKNNARLLSLLGMPRDKIDAGAWLGATTPDFACCEADMECMLRSDMGEEVYAPLAVRFRREYGLRGKKDKKPLLAYLMMREMEQRGIRPERLGRIVEAILDGSAAGGSSQT